VEQSVIYLSMHFVLYFYNCDRTRMSYPQYGRSHMYVCFEFRAVIVSIVTCDVTCIVTQNL
jgi:hypothetical protein